MPYLDPVVQEFIAQASRYIDPVDKMTIAAEAAAKASSNLGDAVSKMNTAIAGVDTAGTVARLANLQGKLGDVRTAIMKTSTATGGLSKSFGNLNDKIGTLFGALVALDVELDKKAAALIKAGISAATLAAAVGLINTRLGANTAANAANNAAQARTIGWFRLTANALHWLVMGTLELAATAIPAMVAFTMAGAAMFPTFDGIYDRMNFLVTAAGGLSNAFAQSVPQLRGFAAGMGKLQQAVAPDAYIIFGAAINAITSRIGNFRSMAEQASNVLANFAVKLSGDFQSAGSIVSGFFANGVKYMVQWGQFFGYLGDTFINIVRSMFGVGQLLLDVLNLIARALADLTSIPWVRDLIGAAAAMSALIRYGQLLITIFNAIRRVALVQWFITLASEMRAAIVAMTALQAAGVVAAGSFTRIGVALTVLRANLLSLWASFGPLLIAMVAIAAIIGVWYLATRKQTDANSKLIAQLEAEAPTVANLSSGIAILAVHMLTLSGNSRVLNDAINILNNGLPENARNWRILQQALGETIATFGNGTINVNAFRNTLKALQGDLNADAAAVQKMWGELKNLQVGLFQTTAGLGTVAAYTTFLSIQDSLAVSKVEQLNQAYQQFMSNVTGGTGGLAEFAQSIANIGQVAGTTANNLGTAVGTMNLSVAQFAQALSQGPIKAAGAWTNFDQVVGSTMPQLVSWLNIARVEGTLTGAQYSQAVLDMAAAMTKFATQSPTAQKELVAFAQAQGLNIRTFPQLKSAIKDSGASFNGLQKLVDGATGAMSDAQKVAENMSAVFKSQVEATMLATSLKVSGFNTDVQNMIKAQQTGLPVAGHSWQYWATLAVTAADLARQHITNDTDAVLGLANAITKIPKTWQTVYTFTYRQVGNPNFGPGGNVGPGGPGHGVGAFIPRGFNAGPGRLSLTVPVAAPQVTVHVHGSLVTQQQVADTVQEALLVKALNQPQYGGAWPGRRR